MGGNMSRKNKIKEGILIAKEVHNDMADKGIAVFDITGSQCPSLRLRIFSSFLQITASLFLCINYLTTQIFYIEKVSLKN